MYYFETVFRVWMQDLSVCEKHYPIENYWYVNDRLRKNPNSYLHKENQLLNV